MHDTDIALTSPGKIIFSQTGVDPGTVMPILRVSSDIEFNGLVPTNTERTHSGQFLAAGMCFSTPEKPATIDPNSFWSVVPGQITVREQTIGIDMSRHPTERFVYFYYFVDNPVIFGVPYMIDN